MFSGYAILWLMSLSKRILFYFLAICFGFFLVVFSALSVSKKADARESLDTSLATNSLSEATKSAQPTLPQTNQEESEVIVEYTLPYPGLLPDHPLYLFKMLRDRTRLMMTSDTTEKFDLLLLYADKRIAAADALIKSGNLEVGVETAQKAEGYLTQAQQLVSTLNEERGELLYRSSLKHQEILQSFSDDFSGELKNELDKVIETNELVVSDLASKYPLELPVSEEATPSGELEVDGSEEVYFPVEISM